MDAWDVTPFVNELGEDAAAWKLGTENKKAEKRKKKEGKVEDNIPNGRKSKRAKLEKLVNWGETDVEEAIEGWSGQGGRDYNREENETIGAELETVHATKGGK